MYGRIRPEPVPRTVWADKTKVILDDIRRRRQTLVDQLDAEERAAKERCNHVLVDGTSTIKELEDDEYNSVYTVCSVCHG